MECDDSRKPFTQLPNEVWIEIFQKVDTPHLLDLSLVCKHWNSLIFNHLSQKFELNFDLDLRKYPRKEIGMVPDRKHKNLLLRSFKLDSPVYLLEMIKQLAANLVSLRLELVSLEMQTLVQMLPLCNKLTELHVKAKYLECDDTLLLAELRPVLSSVHKLSFDVENYVSTFSLFAFEMAFLRMVPSVQDLNLVVYRPLDLGLLIWMAPHLKTLKATVHCDAINSLLAVRLPALQQLDLTLLQPEQQWRKRRTFQARAFAGFLSGCTMLKTALLSFRCEYDQQLLSTIFSSLPLVERLQLSGGLATERFSLNGMERMKFLKDLSLHCLLLFQEDQRIVPMPSVEKFSLCSFIRPNKFNEVLKRFPNLKKLSFRMHGDELGSITEVVPLLEELTVDVSRVMPDMINHMKLLTGIKRLNIDTCAIARTNFRALRGVIVLPELKCLDITTRSAIPANIASAVAAANPGCQLLLNGELVAPAVKVRRSGVKRKQPTAASSPKRSQSINESVMPMDVSEPSTSGASTSGCSSFAMSTDTSNVSFSLANSSSSSAERSGGMAQASNIPKASTSDEGNSSLVVVPSDECLGR